MKNVYNKRDQKETIKKEGGMQIGYACLTKGVRNTNQKSCILKNASEEKLQEIIEYNLNSLEKILYYNIKNGISLYRISSDLIPFGSSPANTLPWDEIFQNQFLNLGKIIKTNHLRLSMHPGQYTVLNSPRPEVVKKAIKDLNYHTRLLDCLKTDYSSKIVLHIGGVYNNKPQAIKRFISHFQQLKPGVRSRIVVENDDKSYTIAEVLEIAKKLQLPVIYDNLHNQLNPVIDKLENDQKGNSFWIEECRRTWTTKDGHQKIHYSQQDSHKRAGSHSSSIHLEEFLAFYNEIKRNDLDIMLEVKDKNLSAVKCINAVCENGHIKQLEKEWSRYKYKVLELSPSNYQAIRNLLNNKDNYPVVPFYNLIEGALSQPQNPGNSRNAVLHVWGYFKEKASETEKKAFLKKLEQLKHDQSQLEPLKRFLFKLAQKYNESYLLDSLYFYI